MKVRIEKKKTCVKLLTKSNPFKECHPHGVELGYLSDMYFGGEKNLTFPHAK